MILKRCFDLLVSLGGLVVLFPVFVLLAFLIKVDSVGPVFFCQRRVGKLCAPFQIYKFRTMVDNPTDIGSSITLDRDPRITKVGRALRKYKLDELPQLINVFLGDMSLVGPRPEVPKYVDAYDENDKNLIFSIKPGITDNASIEFRNESILIKNQNDVDKFYIEKILPVKLNFHREYIEKRSLWLDIKIIVKTIYLILPLNSNKK